MSQKEGPNSLISPTLDPIHQEALRGPERPGTTALKPALGVPSTYLPHSWGAPDEQRHLESPLMISNTVFRTPWHVSQTYYDTVEHPSSASLEQRT
jgi:hypothetical protein